MSRVEVRAVSQRCDLSTGCCSRVPSFHRPRPNYQQNPISLLCYPLVCINRGEASLSNSVYKRSVRTLWTVWCLQEKKIQVSEMQNETVLHQERLRASPSQSLVGIYTFSLRSRVWVWWNGTESCVGHDVIDVTKADTFANGTIIPWRWWVAYQNDIQHAVVGGASLENVAYAKCVCAFRNEISSMSSHAIFLDLFGSKRSTTFFREGGEEIKLALLLLVWLGTPTSSGGPVWTMIIRCHAHVVIL